MRLGIFRMTRLQTMLKKKKTTKEESHPVYTGLKLKSCQGGTALWVFLLPCPLSAQITDIGQLLIYVALWIIGHDTHVCQSLPTERHLQHKGKRSAWLIWCQCIFVPRKLELCIHASQDQQTPQGSHLNFWIKLLWGPLALGIFLPGN